MKYYFIINPKSGKGKHTETLSESIRRECEGRGITYEIYYTKAIGDATSFVADICADSAKLPARFYACGGDGTLGEVVNAVACVDGASVGVIPVGTGNDFVRNFEGRDLFFDISAQIDGTQTPVDLLKCNDIYSINMLNIGFDCEVVKKVVSIKKNPFIPSKLAYIASVVVTLIKKPGLRAKLSLNDGEPTDISLLLTTFANGAFCGGGFHSNPKAALSDGLIDALYIQNVSRAKFIGLVGSYKKGTHLVPKNNDILKNEKINKAHFKFERTQSASIDGELFDFDELTIECIPAAASFILPVGVSRSGAAEPSREDAVCVG